MAILEYLVEPKSVNCLRFLFATIYVGCSAWWTLGTRLNQKVPLASIYLEKFTYLWYYLVNYLDVIAFQDA